MNQGLTKSFKAGAAVTKRRIVKFSADNTVVQGAAATDALIGVSVDIDSDSGARCDVQVQDIALVQSGGVITRGAPITSDANGKAVVAADGQRAIGIAMLAAADGDLFDVLIAPGVVGGGTLAAGVEDTVTLAAGDGAIAAKTGTVKITKASAAALTLADPTNVTDDGKRLTIIAATAFAHTVSNAAGSGFNVGGAGADVGTFGGAVGDNLQLIAMGGKWYVTSKVNVTLG